MSTELFLSGQAPLRQSPELAAAFERLVAAVQPEAYSSFELQEDEHGPVLVIDMCETVGNMHYGAALNALGAFIAEHGKGGAVFQLDLNPTEYEAFGATKADRLAAEIDYCREWSKSWGRRVSNAIEALQKEQQL